MKNIETLLRIILGLAIIVSGVNKFGYWINVSYMEDAMSFVLSLSDIGGGFLIYGLGIIEILIGLALLINKFKILAILAFIPLIVSIITFHLFLDLNGIAIALVVLIIDVALLFIHKDKVAGIFNINS